MPKNKNNKWMDHIWKEQKTRALLFFNLWGYCKIELSKKQMPDPIQLFELAGKRPYGATDLFFNPDSTSDQFLSHLGGGDFLIKNLKVFVGLIDPFYGEVIKTNMSKPFGDNTDILDYLGLDLFGLSLCYEILNPVKLPLQEYLILNNNATQVWGKATYLFYSMGILSRRYSQTSAANLKKKELSKLIDDTIEKHFKRRVEMNPCFADHSYSQQANEIIEDIDGGDIKVAIRTIRRKLASRT